MPHRESNESVWQVNGDRIRQEIDFLSTQVDPGAAGWTRRPFTQWYRQARQWLRGRMDSAGLETTIDACANLIGRRDGTDGALAPIVVGSHIDTVIGGGRFDGVIGVLAGLELARRLQETGTQCRHPLEIVDFTAEETTEFGVSAVGSRGMGGVLTEQMLSTADAQGQTLGEAISGAGGNPGAIPSATRSPGGVSLYLELHIEQGPVLEQGGLTLGVVTGIVGIRRIRISLRGQPSHAGTTPMSLRRDALTGAAEMILALERICRARQQESVVGTAGWLSLKPNAANVVPGQVTFLAEIRAVQAGDIDASLEQFIAESTEVAGRRRLEILVEPVSYSKPVEIDSTIVDLLLRAANETAAPAKRLPSGAGHDANQMALIAPVGMLFVPSRDGLSHCPEEWSELSDITAGIEAMIRAVLLADRERD
jgi:N-carbamoyl-L-amino-acid hydrolase